MRLGQVAGRLRVLVLLLVLRRQDTRDRRFLVCRTRAAARPGIVLADHEWDRQLPGAPLWSPRSLGGRCSRACPWIGWQIGTGRCGSQRARGHVPGLWGNLSDPEAGPARAGILSARAVLRRGCGTRKP